MQPLGPFAGVTGNDDDATSSLFILGFAVSLLRDDAAAAAVENALLPCHGDEDNRMDRWDARLLLDDPTSAAYASSTGRMCRSHGGSGAAYGDAVICEPGVADAEEQADIDRARWEYLPHGDEQAQMQDGAMMQEVATVLPCGAAVPERRMCCTP